MKIDPNREPCDSARSAASDKISARLYLVILLFLILSVPLVTCSQERKSSTPAGADPIPQPAAPTILGAFDKYDVVGMPAGHGLKDLDDFILALLRNPAFPQKVNDIVVECGNSRYQATLDRYIGGENVSFAEVQKVWRNTTQSMCGTSAFYEQLFPLIRTINQALPGTKRLRVLAGDSPVDWDQLTARNIANAPEEFFDRDGNIASVMEKEVLPKHRKALMLFGTMHLMHAPYGGAVTRYEKHFPNVTFVISDLTFFQSGRTGLPRKRFTAWPAPSLALAKSTWLGALDMSYFFPPPVWFDKDCNVLNEFPKEDLRTRMEDLVDAFLYVGPSELALREQIPADIALDADYMKELRRRELLEGDPDASTMTAKEYEQDIVGAAERPLVDLFQRPDKRVIASIHQACLEHRAQANTPK